MEANLPLPPRLLRTWIKSTKVKKAPESRNSKASEWEIHFKHEYFMIINNDKLENKIYYPTALVFFPFCDYLR